MTVDGLRSLLTQEIGARPAGDYRSVVYALSDAAGFSRSGSSRTLVSDLLQQQHIQQYLQHLRQHRAAGTFSMSVQRLRKILSFPAVQQQLAEGVHQQLLQLISGQTHAHSGDGGGDTEAAAADSNDNCKVSSGTAAGTDRAQRSKGTASEGAGAATLAVPADSAAAAAAQAEDKTAAAAQTQTQTELIAAECRIRSSADVLGLSFEEQLQLRGLVQQLLGLEASNLRVQLFLAEYEVSQPMAVCSHGRHQWMAEQQYCRAPCCGTSLSGSHPTCAAVRSQQGLRTRVCHVSPCCSGWSACSQDCRSPQSSSHCSRNRTHSCRKGSSHTSKNNRRTQSSTATKRA